LTLVRWQLDLSVWIHIAGVITLLPESLVQIQRRPFAANKSCGRSPGKLDLESAGRLPRQPWAGLPAAPAGPVLTVNQSQASGKKGGPDQAGPDQPGPNQGFLG
jgi:hypothetical protein